jgi:hypothetical protein
MKKRLPIFFLLSFCFLLSFSQKAPHLKFTETKHNFGYLQKGDIDTLSYPFVNDGGQPLIFTDSKVECNCTKVILPKDPVEPGGSGVVTVIYDSKGAYGIQDRKVVIISNSKSGEETLHFKGEVLVKKKLGF